MPIQVSTAVAVQSWQVQLADTVKHFYQVHLAHGTLQRTVK